MLFKYIAASLLCWLLSSVSLALPGPLAGDPLSLDAAAAARQEQPAVPEPAQAARAGDFSQVAPYNFAYLNDVNTKLIDLSARSVDVVIFSITLKDNPEALLRARDRGVRVRVIIDEAHVYPRADQQVKNLIEKGIELKTLRGTRTYGVNHNKILVCDNAAVATGSYNWTFGATFSNYENTMVAQHPTYVKGYSEYFEWMWSRARTPQQGPSAEVPEGHYGTPPQDPSPVMELNGVKVPAYLFSPGSRSEERLAELLDAARTSLDVVTFTFSSKVLADAVIRAKNRGVKVRFMMDEDMGKTSGLAKLVFASGVPFRWGGGRNEKGALHNKFAIIDGQVLETGSFNWTANASVNSFENMIFTNDPEAVKAYQRVFDWLYERAVAPAEADFDSD